MRVVFEIIKKFDYIHIKRNRDGTYSMTIKGYADKNSEKSYRIKVMKMDDIHFSFEQRKCENDEYGIDINNYAHYIHPFRNYTFIFKGNIIPDDNEVMCYIKPHKLKKIRR